MLFQISRADPISYSAFVAEGAPQGQEVAAAQQRISELTQDISVYEQSLAELKNEITELSNQINLNSAMIKGVNEAILYLELNKLKNFFEDFAAVLAAALLVWLGERFFGRVTALSRPDKCGESLNLGTAADIKQAAEEQVFAAVADVLSVKAENLEQGQQEALVQRLEALKSLRDQIAQSDHMQEIAAAAKAAAMLVVDDQGALAAELDFLKRSDVSVNDDALSKIALAAKTIVSLAARAAVTEAVASVQDNLDRAQNLVGEYILNERKVEESVIVKDVNDTVVASLKDHFGNYTVRMTSLPPQKSTSVKPDSLLGKFIFWNEGMRFFVPLQNIETGVRGIVIQSSDDQGNFSCTVEERTFSDTVKHLHSFTLEPNQDAIKAVEQQINEKARQMLPVFDNAGAARAAENAASPVESGAATSKPGATQSRDDTLEELDETIDSAFANMRKAIQENSDKGSIVENDAAIAVQTLNLAGRLLTRRLREDIQADENLTIALNVAFQVTTIIFSKVLNSNDISGAEELQTMIKNALLPFQQMFTKKEIEVIDSRMPNLNLKLQQKLNNQFAWGERMTSAEWQLSARAELDIFAPLEALLDEVAASTRAKDTSIKAELAQIRQVVGKLLQQVRDAEKKEDVAIAAQAAFIAIASAQKIKIMNGSNMNNSVDQRFTEAKAQVEELVSGVAEYLATEQVLAAKNRFDDHVQKLREQDDDDVRAGITDVLKNFHRDIDFKVIDAPITGELKAGDVIVMDELFGIVLKVENQSVTMLSLANRKVEWAGVQLLSDPLDKVQNSAQRAQMTFEPSGERQMFHRGKIQQSAKILLQNMMQENTSESLAREESVGTGTEENLTQEIEGKAREMARDEVFRLYNDYLDAFSSNKVEDIKKIVNAIGDDFLFEEDNESEISSSSIHPKSFIGKIVFYKGLYYAIVSFDSESAQLAAQTIGYSNGKLVIAIAEGENIPLDALLKTGKIAKHTITPSDIRIEKHVNALQHMMQENQGSTVRASAEPLAAHESAGSAEASEKITLEEIKYIFNILRDVQLEQLIDSAI
ncbi:MAG: hypothetical protein NC924_01650 [Candidatus Omnitrophica bacterium]|nr:hypothetical protein [Candidatus Omnitrophota bacterium]